MGKTTLLDAILRILTAADVRLKLCAPTGRADRRMSEATGVEARTTPVARGRPCERRLQTECRQSARLRPGGRRRGLDGRGPAHARAARRGPRQGRAADRGRHRPAPPCSASTTFAGRVASFEDVTRHPQNDRTRCLGRIASRRHGRPPPLVGRHRLLEVPAHATPCARRGAKPTGLSPPLTPTPTGSRPARHPESGGLPRPVGVVDGRDTPSRPGRKAHNCHLSRGTDGVSPCTL